MAVNSDGLRMTLDVSDEGVVGVQLWDEAGMDEMFIPLARMVASECRVISKYNQIWSGKAIIRALRKSMTAVEKAVAKAEAAEKAKPPAHVSAKIGE